MKACLLFILLFIFSYQSQAIEFRDDRFKINASYDEALWEVVPAEKYRDRLTLKHLNLSATINILAYRFNDTITANGLVQKRIQSVYDGWQLLNQQEISKLQAKKKNITEGIRSIYRKSFLDESLKEQHMIAGDICFVTDDTLGVVLNISVDHPDTLLEVKTEFNKIYTSIWFGDEKPRVNFVVNNSDEWVMDHQNLARKRFYDANFLLSDSTGISNKIELANQSSSTGLKTYTNSNGEYILNGRDLYVIHPASYEVKKVSLNLNDPELILFQNGFYAVQKYPKFKVEKYSNDFNNVETYEGKDQVINAFVINQSMILVEPGKIKLLKDNNIEWSMDHSFKIHAMVAYEDQLIIADTNDTSLNVIDLNSGQALKSLNLSTENAKEVFQDIGMNDSKLLVFTKKDNNINQRIIDLKSFEVEDESSNNYTDFKLSSITNDLIIIQYKNEDNETMLEALDLNTFASVWRLPFNDYTNTVISSNHVLSIDNEQNLVSFELKTAKKGESVSFNNLLNENIATENRQDVAVMSILPLKNKLLAIIKHDSKSKAVYLR